MKKKSRKLSLESLEQRQLLSASLGVTPAPSATVLKSSAAVKFNAGSVPQVVTIPLSSTGVGSVSAKIVKTGNTTSTGSFTFTSPITGTLVLREASGSGTSAFPATLTVYDRNGNPLSSIYNSSSAPSQPYYATQPYLIVDVINVTKGGVYYAQVASQGSTSGAYAIQVAPDDVMNTFSSAAPISLTQASGSVRGGSATTAAKIDYISDLDMFAVTATVTGNMTISDVATQNTLAPLLSLYSSQGALMQQNGLPGKLTATITVSVTAGQSFYIGTAALMNSVGSYSLQIGTVAVSTAGHSFATATPIQITIPTGNTGQVLQPLSASSTTNGTIASGQGDYYRFVAPVSGQMSITENAAASALDSHLFVYSADHTLIWQNDNYNNSLNSMVSIPVAAGVSYYAVAMGHDTSAAPTHSSSRR